MKDKTTETFNEQLNTTKWPKSIIGNMTQEDWDNIDDEMVIGCGFTDTDELHDQLYDHALGCETFFSRMTDEQLMASDYSDWSVGCGLADDEDESDD